MWCAHLAKDTWVFVELSMYTTLYQFPYYLWPVTMVTICLSMMSGKPIYTCFYVLPIPDNRDNNVCIILHTMYSIHNTYSKL